MVKGWRLAAIGVDRPLFAALVFLVIINTEKPFDSLDDKFLISVVWKCVFGPNFLLWIEILLENQVSSVSNERITTQYFKGCVCYFISNFYFSPNYSPSKTMKNVFCFILKSSPFSRYSNFCMFVFPPFFLLSAID